MILIGGAEWPDALGALVAFFGAPLAVVALFQTGSALRAQNCASDLQTVLSIWDKLDAHWTRFRSAKTPDDQRFEFGQLSGYYEMACQLFRNDVLTTNAAKTLEEHLGEILPLMMADPGFSAHFEGLRSKATTFENIRWFCDRESLSKP
jgi:hypothetical protein